MTALTDEPTEPVEPAVGNAGADRQDSNGKLDPDQAYEELVRLSQEMGLYDPPFYCD
ncbi:hypothetical protein [Longimicrobium sp.]|jgi:hypothetical protein|uniref:hypothetical protein n=1 Tax=Longimicrobium sp. TaxID=2029185 RepID=UPI002F9570AD